MCVTKTLPVFSVQSIFLFCVHMSDCMGLVVPNKTHKIPKQVFVWITCILNVCVYRFLYHIVLDLLYFSARAHKAE